MRLVNRWKFLSCSIFVEIWSDEPRRGTCIDLIAASISSLPALSQRTQKFRRKSSTRGGVTLVTRSGPFARKGWKVGLVRRCAIRGQKFSRNKRARAHGHRFESLLTFYFIRERMTDLPGPGNRAPPWMFNELSPTCTTNRGATEYNGLELRGHETSELSPKSIRNSGACVESQRWRDWRPCRWTFQPPSGIYIVVHCCWNIFHLLR